MILVRAGMLAVLLAFGTALGDARVVSAVPLTWPSPKADPRVVATQVLRGPEFQTASEAIAHPEKSWWDLLWERIGKLLERVFGKAARSISPEGVSLIGNIALVLAVFAAALGVTRLLLGLLGRGAAGLLPSGQSPLAARASAARLRERAERAAAAGDFRAALAWLFRASIVLLEERFDLRIAESATPLECRRAVARRVPSARPDFEIIVRAFVTAIYSRAAFGENDWHAAQRAYSALAAPAA